MIFRHGWRATLAAASTFLLARPAHSQVRATIDVGASAVRYDGFLASGAAALTPAFTWDGPRGALTLRGTYLRFESGNRSLQGSVRGSVFTGPAGGWRGEVSASAGASSYAAFARFWHALADVRIHRGGERRGLWIGATGGRTSFGTTEPARPVIAASIAAWLRRDQLTMVASAHRAFVGDTQYSDIDLTVRAQRRRLALETSIGARFLSQGAGRGIFGEGSGILALNERIAVVLSGGRYPTDPIRGSIAGRYVAASVRVRLHAVPTRDPPRLMAPAAVTLTVRPQRDGRVRLVVQGPAADLVEITGDFSEWQPVALRQTTAGTWEAILSIPKGLHRINVRVGGGAWIAPAGTTRVRDDYDGEVGVFVVP